MARGSGEIDSKQFVPRLGIGACRRRALVAAVIAGRARGRGDAGMRFRWPLARPAPRIRVADLDWHGVVPAETVLPLCWAEPCYVSLGHSVGARDVAGKYNQLPSQSW